MAKKTTKSPAAAPEDESEAGLTPETGNFPGGSGDESDVGSDLETESDTKAPTKVVKLKRRPEMGPMEIKDDDSDDTKMAKRIWNYGERVIGFVKERPSLPDGTPVELANINGIPWYGKTGRQAIMPAEVARIAVAAGYVSAALPEGFQNAEPVTPFLTK